ncbi:MAG: penicillin acylase family protein, partial [Pseudomonas sp.]|uniref:penicillin acylase family protein n=1 Tax=Pseudomonas sp. TaxID=306 RepID=UPI00391D4191
MLRLFATLGVFTLFAAGLAVTTQSAVAQALAVVSGTLTVGLYIWLQRSLPPQNGSLKLPGLRDTVEVFRDQQGVPHISARNLHDLYMAQGFVTAQDRLWSMDFARRQAQGRLSQVLGTAWIEYDQLLQKLQFDRAGVESLHAYSSETREHLDAYVSGINACINTRPLPPQFALLRYRPEPWRPADVLTTSKFLFGRADLTWLRDLLQTELITAVGAAK